MLDRLCGLETEYAVRFSPRVPEGPRPATAELWLPLVASLNDLVATGRRGGLFFHEVFTENGGAVSVESKNIVEGKTPECRGPSEVLLYQRAQERLLGEALPGLQERLAIQGFPGELSFIKNCRDADGNVYGAQENYELEVASGAGLVAYRAGVLLAIALAIPSVVATWILVIGFGVALLAAAIVLGLLSIVSAQARLVFSRIDRWMNHLDRSQGAGKAFEISQIALWAPSFFSLILLTRLFAFRRIRRDLGAFFLSRPILTGTGTLAEDGGFQLSEKAPAMRSLVRVWPTSGRCVFDNGNLLKRLQGLFMLDWRSAAGLWSRRQRMQVGLSDSNRAQVAEYLRLATTLLVIDAAEAGLLGGSPRLRRPIRSLHQIAADPGLRVEVPVSGRPAMTALEIQRYYLDRVREYVSRAPAAPVEAWSIVQLWERVLEALATDPQTLVGELDWITKQFLLETAGRDLSPAARKKIDLRYHELGTGYFDRYESGGRAPILLDPAEVARAMREPPLGSPAKIRGALVRRLKEAGDSGRSRISWDSVRVGLRRRGFRLVVPLDGRAEATTGAQQLALVEDSRLVPAPSSRGGEVLELSVRVGRLLAPYRSAPVWVEPIPEEIARAVRERVLPARRSHDALVAVVAPSRRGPGMGTVVVTASHLCFRTEDRRLCVGLAEIEGVRLRGGHLEIRSSSVPRLRVPATVANLPVLLELITQLALWRHTTPDSTRRAEARPTTTDGGAPRLRLVPGPLPLNVGAVSPLSAGAERRPCPDEMCTGTLNERGVCNYCGLEESR